MTAAALAESLASPAEWAGLSPADQGRYLGELNAQGLGLLAARLAPALALPPAAVLARWAAGGLITTVDAFAARRYAGPLS